MTTITTTHGSYKGRTVESIVRRVYGRQAFVVCEGDAVNGDATWTICEPSRLGSGMPVFVARLVSVER